MIAVPATIAPTFESIDEVINYALQRAEGLWEEAGNIAFDELRGIPELYGSLSETLIRERLKDLIRYRSHRTRAALLAPQSDRAIADGALVKMAFRNLYEFPIAGGKKLGDAGKAEVQEQSAFYRTQAITELKRAQWLNSIARGMAGREIVRSRYSLEELTQLLGKAEQWASKKGGKK